MDFDNLTPLSNYLQTELKAYCTQFMGDFGKIFEHKIVFFSYVWRNPCQEVISTQLITWLSEQKIIRLICLRQANMFIIIAHTFVCPSMDSFNITIAPIISIYSLLIMLVLEKEVI